MKPYGRLVKIKGSGRWKKDYHIHHKGRKIGNWWEDMSQDLPKGRINQIVRNQIQSELNNPNHE